MKAKVLNPTRKKTKKKETVAERKKRMARVRSFKTGVKKRTPKKTTRKKPVYKRSAATRKTNPGTVQKKTTRNYIGKIIVALESGAKVELDKSDLTRFRYILKNL